MSGGRLRWRSMVLLEPVEDAALKFLWSGSGDRSAVVGAFYDPQGSVRGRRAHQLGRMTHGDVAIGGSRDQQRRYGGMFHGAFGISLGEIHVVAPAGVCERDFDERSSGCSPEPGSERRVLGHTVVGDLAKGGEGRLDGDGAEIRRDFCGLNCNGRSHRFAK